MRQVMLSAAAFAAFAASAVMLLASASALAEERAEQVVRDAAKLDQVKKVAIMPCVVQLRFDRGNGLPDPARMAGRQTACIRMSEILESRLKSRKYALTSPEAVTAAIKELGWQPEDLYMTIRNASWDSPAETLRNHKGDTAILLARRDEMKRNPLGFTVYRYKWHDLPDVVTGIAGFELGSLAVPDMDKAKALAQKLGVDALLYPQVVDVETHEAGTTLGILVTGERFKSTRVHLHFTMVTPQDGQTIWQARAKGVKSQKTGTFTGTRAYNGEDRKVIEGTVQATDILISDLFDNTGKPTKK